MDEKVPTHLVVVKDKESLTVAYLLRSVGAPQDQTIHAYLVEQGENPRDLYWTSHLITDIPII